MILQKYGIQLCSMQHDDIQKVRSWRNAKHVQKNMLYKGKITSEMQEEWFTNLDGSSAYFMIIHQSISIGVIYVKDINWGNRTGEAGIFIGNQEYHKSYIPMLAIICLMDSFFDQFSFSKLKAKVKKSNNSVLDFNFTLGYKQVNETDTYHELLVSKEAYSKSKMKLLKIINTFDLGDDLSKFSKKEKNYFFLRK